MPNGSNWRGGRDDVGARGFGDTAANCVGSRRRSNTELSQRLGLAITTVRQWRNRFAVDRLDGLLDEPLPGRPRVVGDERIKDLITATFETAPPDATHWATRSMAAHLGLSQSVVSRVWRAFGLIPLKQDSWKVSKDPLFVEKSLLVEYFHQHPNLL
jgi:transposase